MWNPAQPERPQTDEDGNPLLYATMPPKGRNRITRLWTAESMITQFRLYRAARTENIVSHMAIADIYDWIFQDVQDEISKTLMGSIVCLSTLYNPRLLKGKTKTNPSPKVMYVWRDMRELSVGLEWMICTWLPRFCKEYGSPVPGFTSPEDMAQALDIIASLGDDDTLEFETNIWNLNIENDEKDWIEITLGREERNPPPKRRDPVKPRLTKRPDPLV